MHFAFLFLGIDVLEESKIKAVFLISTLDYLFGEDSSTGLQIVFELIFYISLACFYIVLCNLLVFMR